MNNEEWKGDSPFFTNGFPCSIPIGPTLTVYRDADIIYTDIRDLLGYCYELILFQHSVFGVYSAAELSLYPLDAQKGVRPYGYDTLGIFKTHRAKRNGRGA